MLIMTGFIWKPAIIMKTFAACRFLPGRTLGVGGRITVGSDPMLEEFLEIHWE